MNIEYILFEAYLEIAPKQETQFLNFYFEYTTIASQIFTIFVDNLIFFCQICH